MGDFFFNLTEWLRSTWLNGLALDIEDSGSNWFMVEWFWSVPLAQVLHILAISAGFGATLMLTLRVSGMAGQEQPLAQYSARFVPWIWWSLAVIVFSGLLMAWAEPVRNIVNAIFWTKMVLAGAGAVRFAAVPAQTARASGDSGCRLGCQWRHPRHRVGHRDPVVHGNGWRSLDRLRAGLRGNGSHGFLLS